MMHLAKSSTRLATTLLTMALAMAACTDSTGPEDDHHEPAGLRALLSGATVVSINAARQVTGGFTVGAAVTTGPITVQFLDDGGDVINPDDEEYLQVEVDAPARASVVQNPGGAFTIQFTGLTAGTTAVRLNLMHGIFPGGHADYASPDITLTVTP